MGGGGWAQGGSTGGPLSRRWGASAQLCCSSPCLWCLCTCILGGQGQWGVNRRACRQGVWPLPRLGGSLSQIPNLSLGRQPPPHAALGEGLVLPTTSWDPLSLGPVCLLLSCSPPLPPRAPRAQIPALVVIRKCLPTPMPPASIPSVPRSRTPCTWLSPTALLMLTAPPRACAVGRRVPPWSGVFGHLRGTHGAAPQSTTFLPHPSWPFSPSSASW